ncbi:MAG: hypothetical protein NTV11_16560 [Rhodocyclales bacterium]|nr:hypothetical protein [Rhodocyclales bacterium]
MAAADILDALRADGLFVELDGAGIALDGPDDAVARWLPVIRDHKAVLVAALAGAIDAAMIEPQPAAEKAPRADSATLETAKVGADDTAELPKPDLLPDDRRTCSQCANLRQRACAIARPEHGALVVANRGFRPGPARLLRCAGFAPMADDTDQRPGANRWPGLMETLQ